MLDCICVTCSAVHCGCSIACEYTDPPPITKTDSTEASSAASCIAESKSFATHGLPSDSSPCEMVLQTCSYALQAKFGRWTIWPHESEQKTHLLITMFSLPFKGLNLAGILSHVVLPIITALCLPGSATSLVNLLKYDISVGSFHGMSLLRPIPLSRSYATTIWKPRRGVASGCTILRSPTQLACDTNKRVNARIGPACRNTTLALCRRSWSEQWSHAADIVHDHPLNILRRFKRSQSSDAHSVRAIL
jgi:hypothetical protein